MKPVLDETLGKVSLPYDRFTLDAADSSIIKTAMGVEVALCARDQGIDYVASRVFEDVDVYRSQQFFGPWTMKQAEQFAFIRPMRIPDLAANGYIPMESVPARSEELLEISEHNAEISESYIDELEECAERSDVSELRAALSPAKSSPWHTELLQVEDSLFEDQRIAPIQSDLDACLSEAGLVSVKGMPGFVEGFDIDTIDERQIKLAVQVVRCKNAVDYTRRIADVWASKQGPIIKKYERELLMQGSRNDQALKSALAIINSNEAIFDLP